MPALLLRPRIVYNSITLILSLPQKFWTPEEGPVIGDEDKSAASIPVGYYVGWEYAVGVTLRFTDAEYASVTTAIRWMMQNKNTAFTWYFDTDDDASDFSVYLEVPRLPERIKPTRPDTRNPDVWELPLVLRSSAGIALHYLLPID